MCTLGIEPLFSLQDVQPFKCHSDHFALHYCWFPITTSKPPFSKIPQVLTKVWVDQGKLILVVREGKQWGKKEEKWHPLLEKVVIKKLLLPNVPLHRLDHEEAKKVN